MKNISIGQTVYFEDHRSDRILCGTVSNIERKTLCSSPLRVSTDVIIDYVDASGRTTFTRRQPHSLFASEADCQRQIDIDCGKLDIREVYREEIKSVRDLMVFIFTHDMEARRGNPAREVALEKTKGLMGYAHIDGLIGAIEV